MDPKPRPNQAAYLEVLRRMTPEQKLAKAFELSAMDKKQRLASLRRRFPIASADEFRWIVAADLLLNRNDFIKMNHDHVE
jgi:hypothetical protein